MSRHSQYPPLLPQNAVVQPLGPLPLAIRQDVTHRLRSGRAEITRAFLSALNMNMLGAAPPGDRAVVETQLRTLSAQELTRLAQVLTLALRGRMFSPSYDPWGSVGKTNCCG